MSSCANTDVANTHNPDLSPLPSGSTGWPVVHLHFRRGKASIIMWLFGGFSSYFRPPTNTHNTLSRQVKVIVVLRLVVFVWFFPAKGLGRYAVGCCMFFLFFIPFLYLSSSTSLALSLSLQCCYLVLPSKCAWPEALFPTQPGGRELYVSQHHLS